MNKIIYELLGEKEILKDMDGKKVIESIGEEEIIADIGEKNH